jgi:cyclophilin family peptidyl-prolyl cis-trans isomerase/HEAT repeat protein
LEQIAAWEDRRSLGNGALVQWAAASPSPQIRARSFWALARLQETSTLEVILGGLKDPDRSVRVEAAFAAGELALSWDPLPAPVRDRLTVGLLDAETAEPDTAVRVVELEALGKVGNPPAMARLETRLLGGVSDVRARAALSIGVAGKRGGAIPPKAIIDVSAMLARESLRDERFAAAYLLAASKAPAARPALLACTQDEWADVRNLCALGLGEVGTDADAVTLSKLLNDSDYRVVVEAVRALTKLASRCKPASCPALGALALLSDRVERLARGDRSGGGPPLLILAKQGLPPAGRPLLAALRVDLAKAFSSANASARADLAAADCRLAAAMDRQAGALSEVLTCGWGAVPEERRLELGLQELAKAPPSGDPAGRAQAVVGYAAHPSARVRLAALGALEKTPVPALADKLRPLLSGPDVIVAGAAASVLGKWGDAASYPGLRSLAARVSAVPDIADNVAEGLVGSKNKDAIQDLQPWLASPHAHVRTLAAQSLTALTGRPVVLLPVEEPAVAPPPMPRGARLTVLTEHGEIHIQLWSDVAPRTAGNLYQLAKRGFFRKLSFHRVEPDFVAQGGDPRGDGEGGPGYSIRCEINRKPYARGVVGMALSGKDTGGSQFFITTFPEPHLDGRYTTFGEVTAGMEVVDGLAEGERILDIRAEP